MSEPKEKKKFKDSAATDVMATVYPPLSIVNNLVDGAMNIAKKNGNQEGIEALKVGRETYTENYLAFYKLEVEDRKDARQNGDKHLQLVVAYFSIIGFTLFSMINIYLAFEILQNGLEVNEFIIMTTSNLNGIFTGLLFTLKDFLFGGAADKSKI
jgi:hypothetical protein